jgi:voltage-gated potassium channel
MEQRLGRGPFGRAVQRRVEHRGFTPRLAALVIAVFWAVGVVIFGIVERLVDPHTFDNVWLGMWWGVQTVTTVGYGDVVPGNTLGKAIATLLMFGGLSLFAVITGAITSSFVAQAQGKAVGRGQKPLEHRLEEINAQLEAINSELARLKRDGA